MHSSVLSIVRSLFKIPFIASQQIYVKLVPFISFRSRCHLVPSLKF